MQNILTTILFLLLFQLSYGQAPRELTKQDSINIKKQVEKEAALLKAKLEKSDDYISDEGKKLAIEFAIDTFKIHSTMSKYIDIDGSTVGMNEASYKAEDEFDKLLNKYYKKLLAKLSKEDQEALKKSQRSWIAFRDAERELILVLSKDKYSGGGTMQSLINSSEILALTEKRVLEIYSHLTRFSE